MLVESVGGVEDVEDEEGVEGEEGEVAAAYSSSRKPACDKLLNNRSPRLTLNCGNMNTTLRLG